MEFDFVIVGAGSAGCAIANRLSADPRYTVALVEGHIASIDAQIDQLLAARTELQGLADRAKSLDPSACTDPNRCQVISDE